MHKISRTCEREVRNQFALLSIKTVEYLICYINSCFNDLFRNLAVVPNPNFVIVNKNQGELHLFYNFWPVWRHPMSWTHLQSSNSPYSSVTKQCNNLTTTDAPVNGGLVCHWYQEENSQQCGIKCNKGYEFPSRINDFEYCGPTTGYKWSFRQEDPQAIIEPCIGNRICA